jgi:hypothetical protein
MKFKYNFVLIIFIPFVKISIAQEQFVNCDSVYNNFSYMREKFETVMLFTSAPEIANNKT